MKILLSGIAGAIVLGIIAAFVLSAVQNPVYQVFSSSSTRLDDPGSNLIGGAWNGGRTQRATQSGSAGAESGTGGRTVN